MNQGLKDRAATGRRPPQSSAQRTVNARLATAVRQLVVVGDATAASAWVQAADGRTLATAWAGPPTATRPLVAGARFDLASLTKPFVATLALVLDTSGELPLRSQLGDLFVGVHPSLARCPLERLLRHRSGLAAWTPLWARVDGPASAVRWLLAGGGEEGPTAATAVTPWRLLGHPRPTYSDLGYILCGRAIELALGRALWPLLRERVLTPLGLASVATPGSSRRCLPSPLDGRREQELAAAQGLDLSPGMPIAAAGVVQDGNARFLLGGWRGRTPRGIAGHAGLFATAGAVGGLLGEWLRPGRLLDPDRVRRALVGNRPVGWAPARARGSAGPAVSVRGFGHLGSTGGSAWADPVSGNLFVILACRAGWQVDLRPARQRLHAAFTQLLADR